MMRNIFAIRYSEHLLIVTQVSVRKAARLFAAGQTVLIASRGDLNALADRQQKTLVVRRRGRRSFAAYPSAVEIVWPQRASLAAAS